MPAVKRYNVCSPRTYQQNGEERTHFWIIGTAFPLKEKDGFSIKLWTRILPTDELVVLVNEPREQRASSAAKEGEEPGPDDDLPF